MPSYVAGDARIPRRLINGLSRVAAIGDSRFNPAQAHSIFREWEPVNGWDGHQLLHETTRTGGDDAAVSEIGSAANARIDKTGILHNDDGLTGDADDGNDYDDGLVKDKTGVGLNTTGPTGATSKRGPTGYVLYTCDSAGSIPAVSSDDNCIGRRRGATGTIRDSFEANATSGSKIIGGVLRHSNAPSVNIRVGFHSGSTATADQSSYTTATQAGSDPTLVMLETENADATKWPTYEIESGTLAVGDTLLLTPLVQMVKDADAGGMLIVDAQNFGSKRLWHHLADDCSSDANFGTWWSAMDIDTVVLYVGENDDNPDLDVTETATTAEFFEAQVRRLIARFRAEVASSVEFVLFFQHKATTPDSDHPAMAEACRTIAEDTAGVWFGDLYNYYQAQVADGFDADGVHPSSTSGYQAMGQKTWELIELGAAMPDIASDLEAHWALSVNGDDATSNGRDLTLAGTPTYTLGRLVKAISLNGTDQSGAATGYKGVTGTAARSFAAWIRTDDTADQTLVEWGSSATGATWRVRLDNTSGSDYAVRVEVTGGYALGAIAVNDGEWHHIAVVLGADADIEDAEIYIDGVLDDGGSSSARAVDTASSIDVLLGKGAAGGATHWDGEIEDARIYSRALAAVDVTELYQLTVAHYRVYRRSATNGADTLVDAKPAGVLTATVASLDPDSLDYYWVQAVSACGVADTSPVANRLRRVAMDGSADLIDPAPNAPYNLHLVQGPAGLVTARWAYRDAGAEAPAAKFNVYLATGESAISYTTPDFTVNTVSQDNSQALGTFADTTAVKCVVRAVAAGDVEETNTNEATGTADAAAPAVPTSITVTAEAD